MTHIGERADARANRDRVVRAAREVFAERGVAAEIREIAERAGVGMGTVYRNFANRDELVAAIVGECLVEADTFMERAENAATPLEGLEILLAGGFRMADVHGDIIDRLKRQAGHDAQSHPMYQRMERQLARAVEAGVVRGDVPMPFLAALMMAVFMTYRETRDELGDETARRAAADAFFRVALVHPPA